MLSASITFLSRSSDASRAGFSILSGPNERTDIYYQFSNERIIVDRSNTSAAASTTPGINVENESGELRLFDVPGRNESQTLIESLDLTIVVDGGIVEVHAND
jgi:beta-fructofuranosidase